MAKVSLGKGHLDSSNRRDQVRAENKFAKNGLNSLSPLGFIFPR